MLEACALSDKGCLRANNEDCFRVEPEIGLWILADGMGGARAGEHASRMAVDAVAEVMLYRPTRDSQALISAVEEAHRRVVEAARQDASLEGMGTTLVAALETEDGLFIASVGDSRAYLLAETGLHLITSDQTWVNEIGRPLGLDEECLRTHPMRHVLTMAIGAASPLMVKSYAVPLPSRSLILMCSDGLHGVVAEPLIEEILRRGRDGTPLQESCLSLVQAAKEAGAPDNVTVLVMRRA